MKKNDSAKTKRIRVAGESYLELISEQKGASLSSNDTFLKGFGGEGFLLSVALSRLGDQTELTSLIGKDPFGEALLTQLSKEGVLGTSDASLQTPVRFIAFESKEKTATLIYPAGRSELISLPKDPGSALVYFLPAGLNAEELKKIEVRFKEGKKSGEKLILILPSDDQGFGAASEEMIWPLIEETDFVFCIGRRSPSFIAKLEHTLKKQQFSFAIERHPGVFELAIHGEKSNFSFVKKSMPIPGEERILLIAPFIHVYLHAKPIAEGIDMLKKADAHVVERIPLLNALPYLEELKAGPKEGGHHKEEASLHGEDSGGLCFLTFDQFSHFEELARRHRRNDAAIAEFKELIYRAFLKTAATRHRASLGVCVDNCHGEEILAKALAHHYSIIRTVDESTKKEFEEHPYSLIRSWPRKEIVKVLLNLKDGEIPTGDLRWMERLYEAVEETGHQLLIEIYDKERKDREKRVLSAIRALYLHGVHPKLWKLQPSYELSVWRHIEEAINKYDSEAGILVLGDRRPLKDLAKDLKALKESIRKVKGFAIGRSLWQNVAEHWFEKRISDEMVESEVAFNFKRLLTIWEDPAAYHEEEFEDQPLEHMKR